MFKSYSEGNWSSNSQSCFGVILLAISFHSYLGNLYSCLITDPQAWAPLGFSSPCGRFSSLALQVGGSPPAQPPGGQVGSVIELFFLDPFYNFLVRVQKLGLIIEFYYYNLFLVTVLTFGGGALVSCGLGVFE